MLLHVNFVCDEVIVTLDVARLKIMRCQRTHPWFQTFKFAVKLCELAIFRIIENARRYSRLFLLLQTRKFLSSSCGIYNVARLEVICSIDYLTVGINCNTAESTSCCRESE